MRALTIAVLLGLGLALAAHAQRRNPGLAVFGQVLGKPLSIPECERHSAWDAAANERRVLSDRQALVAAGYKPDAITKVEAKAAERAASAAASAPLIYRRTGEDDAPCIRSIGYTEFPPIPADGKVLLHFPRGGEPAWLGDDHVALTLVAGNVTEMRADTGVMSRRVV